MVESAEGQVYPLLRAAAYLIDGPIPRESLFWFCQQMEIKLAENDHKGPWDSYTLQHHIDCIVEETQELVDEIGHFTGGDPSSIIREAADVGNFAFFVADIHHQEDRRKWQS